VLTKHPLVEQGYLGGFVENYHIPIKEMVEPTGIRLEKATNMGLTIIRISCKIRKIQNNYKHDDREY
jgi:hypothetical protein